MDNNQASKANNTSNLTCKKKSHNVYKNKSISKQIKTIDVNNYQIY